MFAWSSGPPLSEVKLMMQFLSISASCSAYTQVVRERQRERDRDRETETETERDLQRLVDAADLHVHGGDLRRRHLVGVAPDGILEVVDVWLRRLVRVVLVVEGNVHEQWRWRGSTCSE